MGGTNKHRTIPLSIWIGIKFVGTKFVDVVRHEGVSGTCFVISDKTGPFDS